MTTASATPPSVFHAARKDIRYLASLVRGLMALDEALGEGADLDRLIAARRAEEAELTNRVALLSEQVIVARQRIEDSETRSLEILTGADRAAAEIRGTADGVLADAAARRADAEREAAEIVAAARAAAEKEREALVGRQSEIQASIADGESRLSSLTAACEAETARLTTIRDQIAALKADLAKLG